MSKLLCNELGFVGKSPPGIHRFHGSDTEELYNNNRQQLGPSWFWYDGPEIEYRINAQGFRMFKDFEDVDLDCYFLSIGCSFAFGEAMPFEETYSYKIANEFNVDLVSLASAGCGMDTFFHNFFIWVHRFPMLPRFVLFGHSDPYRKSYWVDKRFTQYTVNWGKDTRKQSYQEFIRYESQYLFDYKIKLTAIKSYCESHNVKFIEFTGHDCDFLKSINVPNLHTNLTALPTGRDLRNGVCAHPGYEYQLNVAEYVKTQLSQDQ